MSYTRLGDYSYTHTCRGRFKRPRSCWWCREPIVKGDRYVVINQKFDGEFQVLRLHEECNEAWHEGLTFFESGAIICSEGKQERGKCDVNLLCECDW